MRASCLVLLIHGGGFMFGSPIAIENRRAVESAGYPTAPVAYPLGDVAAAYRAAAAAVPRGRPVVAFGESAGGTIAAWLAARRRVDAAVAVGAPTDLRHWPRDASARAYLGLDGRAWRLSPAARYRGQRPLWALHWAHDRIVPFAHAAALRGARVKTLWGDRHLTVPSGVARRTIRTACRTAARRRTQRRGA